MSLNKIIILSLFILFSNIFLFHSFGSVAFILASGGFFLFLLGIFFDNGTHKFISTIIGLAILFVLTSFQILTRANGFINFLDGFFIVLLLTVFAYLLSAKIAFFRSLMELKLVPFLTFGSYIKAFFKTIQFILSGQLRVKTAKVHIKQEKLILAKSIFIGFIIGLPIVLILVSVLSGADPIFATFVKNTLNTILKFLPIKNLNQLGPRTIYNLLLIFFLTPFLFIIGKKTFTSPLSFLSNYSFIYEMTVVMILVALTLGSFLVIQWPYVFVRVAAETSLARFGVATYSEYVRKGFGEFLFASFFTYLLIWLGLLIVRNQKSEKHPFLLYVQMLVLGEFFLFLVSVFRRISLYQQYHGWSLVRIYGGFLLLWVTGITATLFLRHFRNKRYVVVEAVFTTIIILFLGFFNVEHFIVENHPPTVNKRIDYVYLARMSPDGYTGWQKAFDYAQNILGKNYDSKSIINREQRREIAYAAIITHVLSRNYDLLIKEYGSENELKTYFKEVFQMLGESNGQISLYLQPQIESTPAGSMSVAIVPTLPPAPSYIYSYTQEQIKETNFTIETSLKELESKNTRLDKVADSIIIDSWFPIISYDNNAKPPFFYLIKTNDDYSTLSQKIKSNKLDRFFTWNYSRENTYQKMKKEIPISELVKLQKSFVFLYQKIVLQAQNELEYDSDISFDTPFLESF